MYLHATRAAKKKSIRTSKKKNLPHKNWKKWKITLCNIFIWSCIFIQTHCSTYQFIFCPTYFLCFRLHAIHLHPNIFKVSMCIHNIPARQQQYLAYIYVQYWMELRIGFKCVFHFPIYIKQKYRHFFHIQFTQNKQVTTLFISLLYFIMLHNTVSFSGNGIVRQYKIQIFLCALESIHIIHFLVFF